MARVAQPDIATAAAMTAAAAAIFKTVRVGGMRGRITSARVTGSRASDDARRGPEARGWKTAGAQAPSNRIAASAALEDRELRMGFVRLTLRGMLSAGYGKPA